MSLEEDARVRRNGAPARIREGRRRLAMMQPEPQPDSPSSVARIAPATVEDLCRHARSYLARVLAGMAPRPAPESHRPVRGEAALAHRIFSAITSRRFCYLGRKNAEVYREHVVGSLSRRMATGAPFRFFYDIGPGYHATTRPGVLPLRYDVGLSELLILSQVNALCRRIADLYEPGATFFLVIDNLCGLRTNDIPILLTEGYVRKLRRLIQDVRLSDRVRLIVESEEFEVEEYDRLLADVEAQPPVSVFELSPWAIDNVARFLGRRCTATEAAERIERYRRTSAVTDRLVDRLVQDVHMTQRATGATLGFRPFPGGAQRTQAGELVLRFGSRGRVRPLLLTSRNVADYDCVRLEMPDLLPASVTSVTFALPRPPERSAD
jgi:hypothetical protein